MSLRDARRCSMSGEINNPVDSIQQTMDWMRALVKEVCGHPVMLEITFKDGIGSLQWSDQIISLERDSFTVYSGGLRGKKKVRKDDTKKIRFADIESVYISYPSFDYWFGWD
jgi:hypothetical protein